MPEFLVPLLPKMAVMIGEATRKARTPATRSEAPEAEPEQPADGEGVEQRRHSDEERRRQDGHSGGHDGSHLEHGHRLRY